MNDVTERKWVEQKLTLLNTCISKVSDIVMVIQAEPREEPRINFVNDAFERILGYILRFKYSSTMVEHVTGVSQ